MTGRQFSLCPPVSSTNKTDRHDIAEILQKVALSTKNQSMKSIKFLKMSSLLGLLINQSINHIYLLIILKTFFSECGSNNWGTSCAQTCLCDMAKTSDCNNVDGNCTCKTGWQGATCVEDVNECTDNPTICNAVPNSQCNNLNGSYECNCVTGYEKLTNGSCQGRLLLRLFA